MAEWSNAAVLKTVELARAPGVRIPLSPPAKSHQQFDDFFCFKSIEIFGIKN